MAEKTARLPRAVGDYLLPLIGMTFFWCYFRYQSFFEVLYPLDLTVRLGGLECQAHAVFLVVLSLLVLGMIAARRLAGLRARLRARCQTGGGLAGSPTGVASGAFAGTAGVLVMMSAGASEPGLAVVCFSGLLVAFGFVTGYLAWSEHFSAGFCTTDIVVLAGSFALSLLVCGGAARSSIVLRDLIVVLTPLLTGLAWCFSNRRAHCRTADQGAQGQGSAGRDVAGRGATGAPDEGPALASLRSVPSYVVLFLAFLVFDAVVRGVVDFAARGRGLGMRWPVSVVVAAVLLVACIVLWRRARKVAGVQSVGRTGRSGEAAWIMAEHVCLGAWVVLAALSCIGVAWALAADAYSQAGQLVVVARSTLDCVLWIMLCSVASRPGVGPRAVFLVYGLMTQIVSWALSYAIVPFALETLGPRSGGSVENAVVLSALTVLLIVLVGALGTLYLRGRRSGFDGRGARAAGQVRPAGEAGTGSGGLVGYGDPADAVAPREAEPRGGAGFSTATGLFVGVAAATDGAAVVEKRVAEYLASTYGLSPREVETVMQFSQGHSIKHIASDLGISAGTVQSHIKGAYRKLDVHSRDELKGLFDCLVDFARREG